MILVRDPWKELRLSDHIIEAYDGIFKGSTLPMVDFGTYEFKDLNTRKIAPETFFTKD